MLVQVPAKNVKLKVQVSARFVEWQSRNKLDGSIGVVALQVLVQVLLFVV